MVWIDYFIISVIGLSCLLSLIRGFFREVLSLVTLIFAFFFTSQYYTYLSKWWIGIEDKLVRNGISIVVLFIFSFIIFTIISNLIGKMIEKTGLSETDQLLGIFFGALRGILITTVILFFLDTFTDLSKSDSWKKSQFIPQFSFIIRWIFEYLKNSSSFFT